jgi:hypothetical protein
MSSIETKCIEIFKKIDWKHVGKGEDYDQYISLLCEFLRRATVFAESNNININSPWLIIKEIMPNKSHISENTEKIIEDFSNETGSWQSVYVFYGLFGYILFEKAKELGLVAAEEKNIYSPLIKMFMLTGCFHSHHGFIEFNDLTQLQIRHKKWMSFGNRNLPYIEFDEDFDK